MGVADCDGQGVRCILLRYFRQVQKHFEHLLNLVLRCPAVSDDRLLYLEGRILEDRQSGVDPGHYRGSTSLAKLQRALHIGGEKNILDSNCIGAILRYYIR